MWKAIGLVALAAGVLAAQQGADKVYKIGGGVKPPSVLQKVDPIYTKEAAAAKIEGTVVLSLVVGSDGVPRDIQVIRSLEPDCDNSAIVAVEQWKFKPGVKDGEPVSVKATVEINFRLLKKGA